MKRAIVLCGASGTGKTHARMNDPALKNLPHVDVADFYREFPELDGASATAAGCRKARQLLEAHDAIVIEGYYLPGSTTRNWLLNDWRVAGAVVEVREFWTPLETCIERISTQWERGEISAADCRGRIEIKKRRVASCGNSHSMTCPWFQPANALFSLVALLVQECGEHGVGHFGFVNPKGVQCHHVCWLCPLIIAAAHLELTCRHVDQGHSIADADAGV